MPKRVLAAIPDLFFGSKVSGSAAGLGVEVRFASSREALVGGAEAGADLVIVDLDAPAVDPLNAIREIRAARSGGAPKLLGFASHTREGLLRAAEEAGCDQVLTRGALAASLPDLLAAL